MPAYAHVQRAPLCLLLYATAAGAFLAAAVTFGEPWPAALRGWGWIFCGLVMIVLAASFHYLAMTDRGDHLEIRFGPLPVFRRILEYSYITGVEIGRTHWLDGWGIHYSLRRGWVWNLWGRSCVVVMLGQSKLFLGTNDAEGLAAFLRTKITTQAPSEPRVTL